MAKRRSEFIVESAPDVVLELVQAFFESDEWPYPVEQGWSFLYRDRRPRSVVTRPDDTVRGCNRVVILISKPGVLETALGFAWLVALSLLTFGLFLVVYVMWALLIRPVFAKRLSVAAISDEPGWTKLTVEATEPEHAESLVVWIQRELIENKAAARAQAPS